KSGWNTLLAKVSNSTKEHGLFLRLSDDPTELARVYERTSQWNAAFRQWTRQIQRKPTDVQAQFARGRVALLVGDRQAAEESFGPGVANSADRAAAWGLVARICQNGGRVEEAAVYTEKSIATLAERLAADVPDAAVQSRLMAAKIELAAIRLLQGSQL